MTIVINFVLFVLIYCFLTYVKDTEKLLKMYISIIALCDIIILFVFRGSLLSGRLAFSWGDYVSSYKLLGIEVITDGSNGIAYFSAIAILFSTYLFIKKQNKIKYLLCDFLFLFSILATGSRKGIIILVIGLLFLLNLLGKKSQKIIYIMIAIAFIILLFYLIQTVPALYKIMGSRLEGLYNLVLRRDVNDSSISTRQRLIQQAISFIKKRPMIGHGLDAFRIMGPWGIVSDNNYLDILVSSGIFGFLIYYSYIPLVLHDYFKLKKKSDFCKIFFFVFLLNVIMELGQVTYFERNFGFFYAMLFYILHKETYKVDKIKCKTAT
jgi:O-antigen ligase